MKALNPLLTLTLMSSLSLAQISQAQSLLPLPSLKALDDMYQEITDVIYESSFEYVWIDFNTSKHPTLLAKQLGASKTCRVNANFKRVSDEKAEKALTQPISKAIDMLVEGGVLDMDDGYYSRMEAIQEAAYRITNDESGDALIEICTDTTTPAYSDGHKITFVKIDGQLRATVEIGFPD